jgi:hypothetical protein
MLITSIIASSENRTEYLQSWSQSRHVFAHPDLIVEWRYVSTHSLPPQPVEWPAKFVAALSPRGRTIEIH